MKILAKSLFESICSCQIILHSPSVCINTQQIWAGQNTFILDKLNATSKQKNCKDKIEYYLCEEKNTIHYSFFAEFEKKWFEHLDWKG